MATTASIRPQSFDAIRKSALVVVGAGALYFAYAFVTPYFVWSEESYGYYWQHRVPLLFHVMGGSAALLVGVFQLWSGANGKAMSTHPLTGRLYFAAVIVGSIGGIVLSITSAVFGFAWGVSLFSLAVAWLAITCTAVYCIRRRDITAHRQWMTRSYTVTFAFVPDRHRLRPIRCVGNLTSRNVERADMDRLGHAADRVRDPSTASRAMSAKLRRPHEQYRFA